MKQNTRMNKKSKIRNALLIIMNDRSFELSENSLYVRVHVYIVHGNMTFYQYFHIQYISGISILFIYISGISV